jgi:hypothetical protein
MQSLNCAEYLRDEWQLNMHTQISSACLTKCDTELPEVALSCLFHVFFHYATILLFVL